MAGPSWAGFRQNRIQRSDGRYFRAFPVADVRLHRGYRSPAGGGGLRFWHLGHPPEIVFDEVHFVGQARHYLHGEPFLDPHPPIAKLVIAAGIWLFGDKSSSWRLGNATIGTILVGVTYLLGRRMFRSRLGATLAAAFVALDGFFIVDSRIGCIDIVYLTLAAISYWLLFRFMQTPPGLQRRRTLIYLAIALGLCLGSKLYVPAITFLIVVGFVFYTLLRPSSDTEDARGSVRMRQAVGALLLVGSISSIFYIGSFAPHLLSGLVERYRGSLPILQRGAVVRKERFDGHASLPVAMVELADDAAAGCLLAELSAAG